MHHRIGNQIDSFLTQHTHVHTETSTIQPTRAHANSKLFRSFAAHTLLLCLAAAGGEEATKPEVETVKGTKRRLGGEGGNCREARLFFGPPDDISLEETVHSLSDANTLLAIYTRAGSSRRRGEGRLGTHDQGGDGIARLRNGSSLRRNDRRWPRAEARAPRLPQYLDQRLHLTDWKRISP